MNRKIKLIVILLLIAFLTSIIKADDNRIGYSEWSEERSGDANEISTIQYGRSIPLEWSTWSTNKPSGRHFIKRPGFTKYYFSNGDPLIIDNANEKHIHTWNFSEARNVVYFYIDVDTYSNDSDTQGSPLTLKCDGLTVASIDRHDASNNWEGNLDVTCKIVELTMSDNSEGNRNKTRITNTYLGVSNGTTEYSYVTKWSDFQDWRTSESYTAGYYENSQKVKRRKVYSYPLTYNIYYELNGGVTSGELINTYTILDEVIMPSLSKLGYEFNGFYNSDKQIVSKINKGTYGDIYLFADFTRKAPTLFVKTREFNTDEKNPFLEIDFTKNKINPTAYDEIDGDLSKEIIIEEIYYTYKDKIVQMPLYLEIDMTDIVYITFCVSNSDGISTKKKEKFFILGNGSLIDNYKDNIKIYSRYISDKYLDTLDKDSIWNSNEYKKVLIDALS